jgi:hypothetical protein
MPTIRSALSGVTPTDYLLWFPWRYSNRLSAALWFACRYFNRLSYVLYFTLLYFTLLVVTTTSLPLFSEAATASFLSETERLSALSVDTTAD